MDCLGGGGNGIVSDLSIGTHALASSLMVDREIALLTKCSSLWKRMCEVFLDLECAR